jgi:hypothetical protein
MLNVPVNCSIKLPLGPTEAVPTFVAEKVIEAGRPGTEKPFKVVIKTGTLEAVIVSDPAPLLVSVNVLVPVFWPQTRILTDASLWEQSRSDARHANARDRLRSRPGAVTFRWESRM